MGYGKNIWDGAVWQKNLCGLVYWQESTGLPQAFTEVGQVSGGRGGRGRHQVLTVIEDLVEGVTNTNVMIISAGHLLPIGAESDHKSAILH